MMECRDLVLWYKHAAKRNSIMEVTVTSQPRTSGQFRGDTFPLFVYNFETVPPKRFATQTLAPSKATPNGWFPTGNVPKAVPSLARNLVTLLLPEFVTHILTPSKTAN